MPRRRLEDQIQDLAAKAVTAQDPKEVDDVIHQLRGALHERTIRLRKLAAEKLIVLPKVKSVSVTVGNTGTNDMAAN